jgi:2-polyprenyl-3-methyl-5-hydroxy-6-metoxy-1,4-benzoquinol methylase
MKDTKKYQFNFSQILPQAVFNVPGRQKKALTILSVLQDRYPSGLQHLSVLDVGSSTGVIDGFLAEHLQKIVGIDIDENAVRFAKREFKNPNLFFSVGDSMDICIAENRFDVIICSQVYEHVPDAERMMKEIFRVLRPGGVCYFAAGNRLTIMEPHYRLPFLSLLPRPIAHIYLRASGKSQRYYERFMTYWSLKRITEPFELIDYTTKIIRSPNRFHATYMIPERGMKRVLALILINLAYWLLPGYIWILRKPEIHFD